jgi:hypothetical protein
MRYGQPQEIRALTALFCRMMQVPNSGLTKENSCVENNSLPLHFGVSIRHYYMQIVSRHRSVDIAIRLWDGLPRAVRVRFPAGARDLFLLHNDQMEPGAQPFSYPTGTGSCFPEGKAAGL